jgi:hypothetical protein
MPIKTFSDLPQSTYLSGMDVFAFQQDGTTKQIAASATNWVSSEQLDNIVKLTQAEYDALTPDANTMYIIVG